MTPGAFIAKWAAADLTERSAAQQHFLDLCELLGEPKPAEADSKAEWYAFEKGASKTGGGSGWADVWKRGHFGWEYKKRGGDLDKALRQLQQYALALENPPLLVVCDMGEIRIHTNWTNTVSRVHRIALEDLHDAATRQLLKSVFSEPEQLKPGITRQTMTEAAAQKFAELAKDLRAQGHHPEVVAHFVNRLVFAMFAEDVDLLPNKLFTRLLEALGLQRELPVIGPEAVKGVELNPYAAELARVSIWIGEIQWMRHNGFGVSRNPILKPLDNIACHDAIIRADGTEPSWPDADVIVGNPPFLGGKRLRDGLGGDYVDRLFALYRGRVPAEADLVCYWFRKAADLVAAGAVSRVGLVATNSIRGGVNREVLDQAAAAGRIYDAYADEPWILDGAAVRVSLVCFGATDPALVVRLDGQPVAIVNSDLTSTAFDLTKAVRLPENAGVAFMGDTKGGAFDIPGELAREWLQLPNPNGRSNSEVLRPWVNGMDVTRRSADKWIIDFGWTMSEAEAALFQVPFEYVREHVEPVRRENRRELYRIFWWRHVEPRPGMWRALSGLRRFIVTPEVSKHRVFAWLRPPTVPDHKLQVIAKDDDTTFGILSSRIHTAWALAVGSWHGAGNDPRYTISTTFMTFPFPDGLGPSVAAGDYGADPRAVVIAEAARRLNQYRENWLNPPEWAVRQPEVVPGFPDRLLPRDASAAKPLAKRTLTNLYNERPTWLVNAHAELDAAVAAAYGWPADITEDEALERLLVLNHERAVV